MTTQFNRILVANRGEIACRVISSAQSLGYYCIAVYSEADASAPHVKMADEAIAIGASAVGESYLNIDKIIAAAKSSNAQAIHPGYGFLSENSKFAEACQQQGIVFIGPSSEAILLMGNKAESKRLMLEADVPCVPGYQSHAQDDKTMIAAANDIGYPVMIKAAAGGGGRGMRQVTSEAAMLDALTMARNEALSAFGSDELIIEKAVINPRHVEVQIFADQQGNTVHLGERDCSVQRRHQKIIEEAPCPIMTESLREAMGQAAVRVAQSVNYYGAGTVEFLLDTQNDSQNENPFYFLEMNTRLQVEHPVTEMITGLDLVALQIQVAQGLPLGFSQQDIDLYGHAIEVRLYAEDCANGFLPASGKISLWQEADLDDVRTDSGIETEQEISPFYDPMLAKVIAWGTDRHQARLKLIQALRQTLLFGTTTNRDFLIECLQKPDFIDGTATTGFIEKNYQGLNWSAKEPSNECCAIAAVLESTLDYQRSMQSSLLFQPTLKSWSSASSLQSLKHYAITSVNGEVTEFEALVNSSSQANNYQIEVNDDNISVQLLEVTGTYAQLKVNGSTHSVYFHRASQNSNQSLYLSYADTNVTINNLDLQLSAGQQSGDDSIIVAPMHGIILELLVAKGDAVEAGQPVLVLEAMKMHHQVCAESDATVESIFTEQGKQVATNDLLIQLNKK